MLSILSLGLMRTLLGYCAIVLCLFFVSVAYFSNREQVALFGVHHWQLRPRFHLLNALKYCLEHQLVVIVDFRNSFPLYFDFLLIFDSLFKTLIPNSGWSDSPSKKNFDSYLKSFDLKLMLFSECYMQLIVCFILQFVVIFLDLAIFPLSFHYVRRLPLLDQVFCYVQHLMFADLSFVLDYSCLFWQIYCHLRPL